MTRGKGNKMDAKTRNFVKKKLRLASLSNPSRNKAKQISKVAPATFECNHCSCYIYEGSSDKNLKTLEKEFPSKVFKREKAQADHKTPVREGKGKWDWDDYIESLFCGVENYQILCNDCHKEKSKKDKK